MRNFYSCTITGADDKVDPAKLIELSKKYPFVEWGILFYKPKEGKQRYPSAKWTTEFFRQRILAGHPVKVSAHLCGDYVKGFVEQPNMGLEFYGAGDFFDRIQLNFQCPCEGLDMDKLRQAIDDVSIPVITQHNAANAKLWSTIGVSNQQILFDSSLGNGVEVKYWPKPLDGRVCGYAGGLGSHNIEKELPRIIQTAGGRRFWIDMESGVRLDNEFDLAKVEFVLETTKRLVA